MRCVAKDHCRLYTIIAKNRRNAYYIPTERLRCLYTNDATSVANDATSVANDATSVPNDATSVASKNDIPAELRDRIGKVGKRITFRYPDMINHPNQRHIGIPQ